MNLQERLESIIGRDDKYEDRKKPAIKIRYRNDLKAVQRKKIPEAAATIAADLKVIVGEDEPITRKNAHIDVEREGKNKLRAELRTAIARYCGIEEGEKKV